MFYDHHVGEHAKLCPVNKWRILLWSPYVIGQTIIFLPCGFFFLLLSFFSSPNLSGRRLDVYHKLTSSQWTSVNLECRSETCCARLPGNAGPKKVAKNLHLGTITQLCRAISSQLRHISTIGKNLFKERYLLYMSS